jgi:tetratricopeptide (TPR) repeat protein
MHKTLHIALIILLLAVLLGACSRQRDVTGDPAASPPGTEQQQQVAQQADSEEEAVNDGQTAETAASTDESEAAYLERTNRALEHLVLAQLAIEDRMPNLALYEINRSLYFLETADGLALKGSIMYLLGNINEARTFWQNAYDMDPNALHDYLPGIPEAFDR